jgi:pentachlorophenol monooxygenase
LALHPQSIQLLKEFDLAEKALENSYPVAKIGIYRGSERVEEIVIGDVSQPETCVAVLRQDAIEALLEKALENLGVKVMWRHEVSQARNVGGHAESRLVKYEKDSRGYVVAHSEWVVAKSATVETPFLIGADGYKSETRQGLGIDYEEAGPTQYYGVFEFRSDTDLENEMRVVLGDTHTDVVWPLPGGMCRWSFQLPDDAITRPKREKDRLRLSAGLASSPILDAEHLKKLILDRAPWFRGSIEGFNWRMLVRFERRLATSYGSDRIWLAGDSAHLTGPAGVQSMNVGFFEAHDLADRIEKVLGGAPISEMDGYGDRWLREWRRLHGHEDQFKPQPEAKAPVRDHVADLMSCFPAHGEKLTDLANQIGLRG